MCVEFEKVVSLQSERLWCSSLLEAHHANPNATQEHKWHNFACCTPVRAVMHTSQFNVCLPFADTQVVTYFNEVFCPLLHNCVHIKYICGIASYHSPLECTDACTEGAHTHVQF
mmetsp:Transcript_45667/g.74641  ORF Transcript_45667/g.74641 Transcript_45667/m.74641 type:complete len:114 (-) Transcript_45667:160-501(-)